MGKNSKIEWTDHTANFWWGCQKVSPGCKNCYAERMEMRFGVGGIWGPTKTTDRRIMMGIKDRLIKWNRSAQRKGVRRRVFVQSMSDFFEDHPPVFEHRKRAWSLMSCLDALDFLILTKRPENIVRLSPAWDKWPDNFWIGTSVEDQRRANERITPLLDVPAPLRFLSCEPLLEPLYLEPWLYSFSRGAYKDPPVDWVIVGGESGPGKRPMELDWARSIRDQCKAAGVPFFMKQVDKVQSIPDDLMIREFPGGDE